MNLKSKYLTAGIIIFSATMGCENEPDVLQKTYTFSISCSSGSLWVDYSYKTTIDQTGLLLIVERNHIGNVERNAEYQISATELKQIKDALTDMASVELNDTYGFGEDGPTDLPVKQVKYTIGNKTDSTSFCSPNEGELPPGPDVPAKNC